MLLLWSPTDGNLRPSGFVENEGAVLDVSTAVVLLAGAILGGCWPLTNAVGRTILSCETPTSLWGRKKLVGDWMDDWIGPGDWLIARGILKFVIC